MKEDEVTQSLPAILPSINVIDVRSKFHGLLSYLGPAFVVSVAYMDPGNFGTNISGGSKFAYSLIWVILWSNIMAIFVQIISAKIGIATGCGLPEHCGKIFSRRANWGLWTVATLAAMATDLAEFLGGVLGFHLLFNVSLIWAVVLTAGVTFIICYMQKYGQKIVEKIITIMVAVISLCYVWEMFIAKPDWTQVVYHIAVPSISSDSMLVATGMLGATVMPHVIYLHSHLVQPRRNGGQEDCKHHLKMAKIDVFIAMNMAFVVNAAMVIVSATIFNGNGLSVDSIETAYMTLQPLMGNMAAGAFGLALLASGLSSATVGTMAGEVILNGFVGFDIPINIRRIITMLPGIAILIIGVNPMNALVISQVVLSFALPAAIIPLMIVSNRVNIMGSFKNGLATNLIGGLIVSIILIMNIVLLYLILTGQA